MAEESVRTRNKAKTQQRLLAAARDLFYGGGVCATGVSAVAERAGVTKMTLYPHFPSKEELVTAYLEDSDRRWREFLEERLSGCEDSRDGLLAVCDAYREYFTAREVRGCAFVNCAAEAGAEDLATLAERLFVVLEGAYVTGALEGDRGVLDRSRAFFVDLVEAAVPDRP